MFRHKPHLQPPACTLPVEPIHGLFFSSDQRYLHFGSDRSVPTAKRPALCLRKQDHFAIVLPATSKAPNSASVAWFYPLDSAKGQVLWDKQEQRKTYVYYRYETLPLNALGVKIGVVPQTERMNIARWQVVFFQAKNGL